MRGSLLLLLLLVFSSNLFAQGNKSIGLHSGILFSAFEDQDETFTAIPVGGYFGMEVSNNMEFGAEVNMTVKHFEEEDQGITGSITQTVMGAYLRYFFPSESAIPYIRAGLGYYVGEFKLSGDGASGSVDFKGAVGFNIGAGIGTESGLYAEFIYHIVSRELDISGAEALGANNFGAHIGYAFSIN